MIAALLVAATAPETAVDAERAFAARAQVAGQWRAFAEYAAPEAVMFVPQQVDAHDWLPKQAEPKHAVVWSPAQSFVSCDGESAVNTGPWSLAAETLDGYFTTVWRRQGGAWKWTYDGGAPLAKARALVAEPSVERASCIKAPISGMPIRPIGSTGGGGSSRDRSLLWSWTVAADGSRTFTARLWTGEEYRTVVSDRAPAS